jgi:hypothetical protein
LGYVTPSEFAARWKEEKKKPKTAQKPRLHLDHKMGADQVSNTCKNLRCGRDSVNLPQ